MRALYNRSEIDFEVRVRVADSVEAKCMHSGFLAVVRGKNEVAGAPTKGEGGVEENFSWSKRILLDEQGSFGE